jgi:hypothetical protein
MNKRKWRDPMIPMSVLALKLCEEAAEVGTEITDAHMRSPVASMTADQADRIMEELSHVIFIAETMRSRVRATGHGW